MIKPMSPILDLPNFKNRAHLVTVEEYHKMGELEYLPKRTELIEGVILHKKPKSPKHATLVLILSQIFSQKLPITFHVRTEQPITLSHSEPEPDLAIVRGQIREYSQSHPVSAELVIEVSLSTLAEDREMANIYAEANIPEYWLFNLNTNTVEAYSKPIGGRYSEMKTFQKSEIIFPLNFPQTKLILSEIF
jgi:Uma2 family endonuclease